LSANGILATVDGPPVKWILLIAVLAAAAIPAQARAGQTDATQPTIVAREVPLHGERMLAGAAPARFDLVGLHWRGSGRVEFRTRSLAGRWSEWLDAAPEAEDGPDARSAERARAAGWRTGNPWWVGASNRIEYRRTGTVTRLRTK
jgi:hypothetical protein